MVFSPCLEDFVVVNVSMLLAFAVVFSLDGFVSTDVSCESSPASIKDTNLLLGDLVVALLNKIFYVMDKVSKPWTSHL